MAGGGGGGDDGGGHGRGRGMAGGHCIRRTLDKAEHVGGSGFGGEVVHLVIEQEAEAFGSGSAAEAAVEGVGHGNGISLLVDDGEVGGLGGFFGLGFGGRWWRKETCGAFQIGGGRGFGGV